MNSFGYFSIYLALVFSVYSFFAYLYGLKRGNGHFIKSAKRVSLVVAGIIIVDSILLLTALGTSDFSIKYVANYTNQSLPLLYKLSAFWAGNAGSLLLWELTLTVFTVMNVFNRKLENTQLLPYVGIVLTANSIFFLIVMGFVDNPFTLLPQLAVDGRGLNPLLQNPGMIIHPVALYLGYVGFSIPFAYAVAALFVKDLNNDFWIRHTRRWSLLSWLALTAGILLGGAWAYEELGWGGIWMWDPVENASLFPWLTSTAFIHSVMMQERRNMLKVWNIVLITLTYLLTLFGTFLVRSGVLTSVHAFGDSSIGTYFLAFIIFSSAISIFLIVTRFSLLQRSSGEFESLISKESSFLLNNLILIGIFFATFLGTMFPLLSELFTDRKITVGMPFFNQVNGPILVALLSLMGICPFLAWQKSNKKQFGYNFIFPFSLAVLSVFILFISGLRNIWALTSFPLLVFILATHIIEFIRDTITRRKMSGENFPVAFIRLIVRNRRRYGGFLVHIGIAVMAAGIIGYTQFMSKTTITLSKKESVKIADYTFTYMDIGEERLGDVDVVYIEINMYKNGEFITALRPEKVFYSYWPEMPTSEVAIDSNLLRDIYIVLAGWESDGRATFEIRIIPLVMLIWIGGLILFTGALFAVSSGRYGNKVPKYYINNGTSNV